MGAVLGQPCPLVRVLVVPVPSAMGGHTVALAKEQSSVSASDKERHCIWDTEGDEAGPAVHLPGEEMRQVGQEGTGVRTPPDVSVHPPFAVRWLGQTVGRSVRT